VPTRRSLPRAGRVWWAAVLMLALAACGGGEDGATGARTQAPASTEAAATSTPAPTDATTQAADTSAVTLITAGEEPRTELRYDLTDGQPVSATIRQTQELTQIIEGQRGPQVSLTSLFDLVGDVRTDGDVFTMRVSLENGRVADDTDPDLAEAMSESMSTLEGMTFVNTFDARGQIIDSGIENADAYEGNPMMSIIDQSSLSAPLPEEPVGVGARWSSTQKLDSQGVEVTQITETELLSIDGSEAELKVTTTQDVPPGPVTMQTGQGEAEVDIRVWDVTGEGRSLVDLTMPIPMSEARTSGHQEMTTTLDGQTSTLEQDITVDMKLTPN
jgi:hypothetical protein